MMAPMAIRRRWPLLTALALTLGVAACSGADEPEPEPAGLSEADQAACEQYIPAVDERQEVRAQLGREPTRGELDDYVEAGKDLDAFAAELADTVTTPLLADSLRQAAETRDNDAMRYHLTVERIRGMCGGWLTVPS